MEFKALPRVEKLDAHKVYVRCMRILETQQPVRHDTKNGTMLFRVGLWDIYAKKKQNVGYVGYNFTIHMDDGRCFGLISQGPVQFWSRAAENAGPNGCTIPDEGDYAEMRLVL
jgi:hypothetical protein